MSRPPRFRTAAVVLIAAWLAPSAAWAGDEHRHSRQTSLFSAAEYREHVGYLASDELEGRGTGQPGIDKAADYIADYFAQCGVQPAGDNDTYFQEFTLKLKNDIADGTRLAVGVQGRKLRRPLTVREDFIPFPFSKSDGFRGEVVFAGYGIVNEELGYDDYAGLDVAGKVLLIFRRAPKFDEFSGRDATFRTKATRANARDAAALLVVNPADDEEGDKLYEFVSDSGGFFGGRSSYGLPMVHIKREVAEAMLAAAGRPGLAELAQQIEDGRKPASTVLTGVTVKGRVDIQPIETLVRNVVGLIPGTGNNADQIIALGAHYDHLGVQNKNEANFNPARDIFNGADDNASGTALVMTLANAYTQGEAPNRSLLLMTFTGEELGLLGSHYFVAHPTVDFDKIIAMLNFDMVGRLNKNRLDAYGARGAGLEDLIKRLAQPYDLEIRGTEDAGYGSDHAAFQSKNIPSVFFFTGIHRQYHRPTDDVGLIDTEGAMRIARLAADCIDELDAMSELPKPGTKMEPPEIAIQAKPAEAPRPPSPVEERSERRVRLGVSGEPDRNPGALVGKVIENSPAERAGIRPGDRIVKLGDTTVGSFEDLVRALAAFQPGDGTIVVIKRGDQEVELKVRFDGGPAKGAGEKARDEKSEAEADPDRHAKLARSLAESIADILRTHGGGPGSVAVKVGATTVTIEVDAATPTADPRPSDPTEQILRFVTEAVAKNDTPKADLIEIRVKASNLNLNLRFQFEISETEQPESMR